MKFNSSKVNLNKFCEKFLKKLVCGDFNQYDLKNWLIEYFGKKGYKGVRNKDVADSIIKLLYKKSIIKNQEDLNKFKLSSNFLSKYSKVPLDKLVGNIKVDKAFIEKIDAVKKGKVFEYIKKEKETEIEKSIEEKKEIYNSLPSVIDQEIIKEPKDKKSESDIKQTWWQKLNLSNDPFPTQEGLKRIDEEMYESVIYKTKCFKKIINLFEQDTKNFIYKGTLLYGSFGVGKTTIIDYLKYYLYSKYKISSIVIKLQQEKDVVDYNKKFESELLRCLKKRCLQFPQINTNSVSSNFEDIALLMMELQNLGINGFMIFLDDLHKHNNSQLIMEFLGQLQITKDKLLEEEINVGFIVTGLETWNDGLSKNPRLTGFFDNTSIGIDTPNPEDIFEVISSRLKAFQLDKNKKISIDRSYIEKVYKKAKEQGVSDGYRGVVSAIINELKNEKLSLFDIDPINLPKDKKEAIKNEIENNTLIKDKINKYYYGGGIDKVENRIRGFQVLSGIYYKNGISENEEEFKENIFYFQKLKEAQLIQKQRYDNSFKWIVDENFSKFNKTIQEKYGYSMENYLTSIYKQTIKITKNKSNRSIKEDEIKRYKNFIEKNQKLIKPVEEELLSESLKDFSEIFINLELSKFHNNYEPIIDKCTDSITRISKAIFNIENLNFLKIGLNIQESWSYHWRRPEEIVEYFNEVNNLDIIEEEKIAIIIHKYIYAYRTLMLYLIDLFDHYSNRYSPYNNYLLVNEQIKFDEFFDKLENRSIIDGYLYEIASDIVQFLEQKIRNYLYLTSTIIFGKREDRFKEIPETILSYIIADDKYSFKEFNEFESLNRGQYKVINESHETPFYKLIWNPVFSIWNDSDRKFFLNNFADYNIIASHQKEHSIENIDYGRIENFVKKTKELVSNINKFYINLLNGAYQISQKDNNHLYLITPLGFKKNTDVKTYGKNDFLLSESLNNIYIDDNVLKKVSNFFKDKNELAKINLEDKYYIENSFNCDYREVFFALAILIKQNQIQPIDYYGCELLFK